MGKQAFDYYYGDESNQFSFYRIPRQLITGEQFKKLSTDAKLLYGLLLDRMGLSAKNGWYDSQGRVYIYYTLDEIQTDLGCGHEKAVKLLAELDTGKGFGLIERVKRGQGRPAKIYVKRFTTGEKPPQPSQPQDIPRLPIFGSQDFGKSEVKSSEKQKSRLPVFGSADFGKSDAIYIESNQTDPIQLDPSIHPSPSPPGTGWIDRIDCGRDVRESIDYAALCTQFNREDVDEVAELITDVLCSTRATLRIGGEELPTAQVKERFYKLDYSHLEKRMEGVHKMKWKSMILSAALLAALTVTPANALDYPIDSPSPGDFGTPTSDDTVYVGTEATANVDRSKNAALIPPSFGSPTSYLPGSGEPLTPNLAGSGGAVTALNPSGGGSAVTGGVMVYPGAVTTPGAAYPVTAYTDVTDDLYYSGGYLGTLKIPSLDVNVKVYQGTGSATLAKGAGHFPDTSIWAGNVCVAGHNRGTNCYFGEIHTLDIGDTIKLTTKLGTRTYAVTSVEKISETDNSMLAATSKNCITLFTCVRNQSAYRWCVRAVEV